MIVDDAIHDAVEGLKNVRWRETAFADLQWYYAEGGVYIMRCKKGDPNEHLCIIRAGSSDEAISRAVFNLYKADEKKKPAPVGDMAAIRKALDDATSTLESILDAFSKGTGGVYKSDVAEVINAARAALAKPARNCDVYDAKTAEKEFVRQTGSKSIRSKSVRWLYAPHNSEVAS